MASAAATSTTPPPSGTEGRINTFVEFGSASVPYCSVAGNYPFYQAKIDRALVYGGAPSILYSGLGDRAWYYADFGVIYNNNYNGPSGNFTNYVPGSTNQSAYILKDAAAGNRLFLPYGTPSAGEYAQYAADPGNTGWQDFYRTYNIQNGINVGCMGTRMDDVNMSAYETYTSNGSGVHVQPYDPRTTATMTLANYNLYIAQMAEDIRAALPAAHELLCNTVPVNSNVGTTRCFSDSSYQRLVAACSYMEIERGINDNYDGGNGRYSWQALYEYFDYCHSVGTGLLWHTYATAHADLEYQIATYFLLNDGNDYVGGCMPIGDPASYWDAYDIDLGGAAGARYTWNGMIRRDFAYGFALVNPPGATTKTNQALGGTFINTSDASVTTVTLTASRGAVFRNP